MLRIYVQFTFGGWDYYVDVLDADLDTDCVEEASRFDLCLVSPDGTYATDHLSPSSSVLCCRLHLPPAVLVSCCPYFFLRISSPSIPWSPCSSVAL